MFFFFDFFLIIGVGVKVFLWVDEIKCDFIFGLVFFFIVGRVVVKLFLEGVFECGIIFLFVFYLVVNLFFVWVCWFIVGEVVNCFFLRLEGFKRLYDKFFELDVENFMCGFFINGVVFFFLRYVMNVGFV